MEGNNIFEVNQQNNSFSIKKSALKNSFAPDDGAKGMLFFLIFETILVACYYAFAILGFAGSVFATIVNYLLEAGFVLVVIFVAKRSNVDVVKALNFKTKFNWWYVPLCLCVSLICLFGLSHLTDLFISFMYSIGYQSVVSDVEVSTFGNYIYNVIFVAVVPAICEETLFRGLIYQSLNKVNRWLAIFGSSLLFMLIHGSPDQTVHQFILAIILAFCFEATGNLIVPILIHFFNNFIAVTYSYIAYSSSAVASEATEEVASDVSIFSYIIYVLLFTAVSVVLIALIVKAFRKLSGKNNISEISAVDVETHESIDAFILNGDDSIISAINSDGNTIKDKPNEKITLSSSAKIMYAVAIAWMLYDWISACLQGFGIL